MPDRSYGVESAIERLLGQPGGLARLAAAVATATGGSAATIQASYQSVIDADPAAGAGRHAQRIGVLIRAAGTAAEDAAVAC
jgi:hypothetical protein